VSGISRLSARDRGDVRVADANPSGRQDTQNRTLVRDACETTFGPTDVQLRIARLRTARAYDCAVPGINRRQVGIVVAVSVLSLVASTLAVAALEGYAAVPNASIVYLAAVVATAIVAGLPGAVIVSIGAFLIYDFFFTEPYHTLTIKDPGEWLSVILLLFVGIVVGQLAALQRSRAEDAQAREREARALFQVSRELATRDSTPAVLPSIVRALRSETDMARTWISLGADDASERVAADTADEPRPTMSGLQHILQRMPGDEPAQWVRVHQPTVRARTASDFAAYRVRIASGGSSLGSIWALRDRARGKPTRTETRLLAAAADQLGQALAHDRLAAEAQAAEIARQSDDLKSALLQSVSHDLRTPLATIRAAAGTLRPGANLSVEDQRQSADAIDREVEYLNRMVTNLLDLSRIEAGALRAERDVFEIDDLVGQTLERLRPRLAGRPLEVTLPDVPVDIDPIFLDSAVTNIVENALKHTAPGTRVRITVHQPPEESVLRLTVEDAGEGVPPESLGRLFDKFYRVPGRHRGSRSGTGIGLAVVRGLMEATDGRVRARASELGGLAIDLDLPIAAVPADLAGAAPR
jgi:two-component system sensor histidine kinase KdpD